jgi:drug/metabolite transporter (DMT)-like permease
MPLNAPRLTLKISANTRGLLAAAVTVLIWTSFIVIARAFADPARAPTLTPLDIVFARIAGAALVLLPVGWWLTREARMRQRRDGTAAWAGSFFGFSPLPLRMTVTCGVFGGLLYAMLAYSGFAYAPAAHGSVLLPGSLPLWTALLAVGLLGDRISPTRALGLGLILVGDLLVGGASLLHAFDGSGVWRGDLLFMGGAIVWSTYSVLVRKHSLPAVHATTAITVFAVFTFVPVYAALVLTGLVAGHVFTAPWRDIALQMLMQGLGSVVVSGITFNIMIRHYGPVRSTMLTALVPGLSALAAALFLHEPLPWNVLLGLTLVTVGIVFGVRKALLPAVPVGLKKNAAAGL